MFTPGAAITRSSRWLNEARLPLRIDGAHRGNVRAGGGIAQARGAIAGEVVAGGDRDENAGALELHELVFELAPGGALVPL